MKKTMLLALGLQTLLFADSFKHNEQVFTANTMEVECSEEPKMLYFGTAEEVTKEISKEIELLSSGNVDSIHGDILTFLKGANFGDNSLKFGSVLGVSQVLAAYLGKQQYMVLRGMFSDPEYMYISECNKEETYTRLISLVVLNDKSEDLEIVKELALTDQKQFIKK